MVDRKSCELPRTVNSCLYCLRNRTRRRINVWPRCFPSAIHGLKLVSNNNDKFVKTAIVFRAHRISNICAKNRSAVFLTEGTANDVHRDTRVSKIARKIKSCYGTSWLKSFEKREKKNRHGKVARQAICTQRRCTRANNVVSVARDTRNVGLRKTFLSRLQRKHDRWNIKRQLLILAPPIQIVNLFVSRRKTAQRKTESLFASNFSTNRK